MMTTITLNVERVDELRCVLAGEADEANEGGRRETGSRLAALVDQIDAQCREAND